MELNLPHIDESKNSVYNYEEHDGKDLLRGEQRVCMPGDCFVFSTPLLPRESCETASVFHLSKDSGFSDHIFNSSSREGSTYSLSSLSSSSASSIPSSIHLEADDSRRLILTDCEFSPINYRSSGIYSSAQAQTGNSRRLTFTVCQTSPIKHRPLSRIKGRRLKFNAFEPRPSPHQFSCSEEDHTELNALFNQCSTTTGNSISAVQNVTECIISPEFSNSHSRMGAGSDIDLQEMSMEELSSALSSFDVCPDHLKEINCTPERLGKTTLLSSPISCSSCVTLWQPNSGQEQPMLIKPLCLSVENEQTLKDDLPSLTTSKGGHSSLLSSATSFLDVHKYVHSNNEIKHEFLSKLALTPINFNEHHPFSNSDLPKQNGILDFDQDIANIQSVKSSYINSPTSFCTEFKVPSLPCEFSLLGQNSHDSYKNVKDWLLVDVESNIEQKNSSRFNPSSHSSMLISPCKRSCDSSDDSGLLFSPTKSRKILPGSSNQYHIRDKQKIIASPRKDTVRNIWKEEKAKDIKTPYSLVEDYCKESKHNSLAEKASIRHFEHGYDDNAQQSESAGLGKMDWLHKVVSAYSPLEPSRLIGRNIGVQKFDIVHKLNHCNLHVCLKKIFNQLDASDLVSICKVSCEWKSALFSDHKAYSRYKQHVKACSQTAAQHGLGKENSTEKPLDLPAHLQLTASRGHLMSVQPKAQVTHVQPVPTAILPKTTLMCDDRLRLCPHCQGVALIKHRQDRATCMKCDYDFCIRCFESFHHPRPCKPLCKAPSRTDLAGTRRSRKNVKRL